MKKVRTNVCQRSLIDRELGVRGHPTLGSTDRMYKRLYSSFDANLTHDDKFFIYSDYSGSSACSGLGPTGAIFNLAFSPDGSLLGAATERKSILLFDPISRKLINHIENAHTDSVNCIRFLDTRLFATCSDDSLVALWDSRYMKTRLRTLKGHSNWVKNIEFSYKENCLVSSGFDGAIYLWDINKYSEGNLECTKAFYNNGLMRMKLTQDGTKMVISTANSYLMIIHDLCLEKLSQDLKNFKPSLYRIMQISGKPLITGYTFTHLFHAKRNRVEFVTDFPPSNDAEVISSLQLHPQGWVAVSRNISLGDQSEFCCVHDIQSYPTDRNKDTPFSEGSLPIDDGFSGIAAFVHSSRVAMPPMRNLIRTRRNAIDGDRPIEIENDAPPGVERVPNGNPRGNRPENLTNRQRRLFLDNTQFNSIGSFDFDFPNLVSMMGILNRGVEFQVNELRPEERVEFQNNENPQAARNLQPQIQGFLLLHRRRLSEREDTGNTEQSSHQSTDPRIRVPSVQPKDARLHHNTPRLTHFIEESNHCRGYIKELSFSSDGRIIASPFAHGIRLLAFDDEVRELSDCPPDYPSSSGKNLKEVELLTKYHNDSVLATAFSPFHFTLVSGCMAGKIVWHQPMM